MKQFKAGEIPEIVSRETIKQEIIINVSRETIKTCKNRQNVSRETLLEVLSPYDRMSIRLKKETFMGNIIAVANQKGGVGKSTTAINLSACLAEEGKNVLVVDMDPQGNTTSGLGIDKGSLEKSVYDALIGETALSEVVIKTEDEHLSVIPASEDLAGAEIELLEVDDRESRLKRKLTRFAKQYDFVLIDCPPSLSLLTINSLAAADSVMIPIQCEFYALEGLSQMLHTLDLIKSRLNRKLAVEGIVFTMYDGRTNLSQDVVANVKENLNARIFETVIPRNIRLAEAPGYGMPITKYDTHSAGAAAYRALAQEFLKGKEENGGKKKWSWKRLGFVDSK